MQKIFAIFFWSGILLFSAPSPAQYATTPDLSGIGLPYFNAKIFPTFSHDGSQQKIRVYVQMLNDDLTFLKSDSGFQAELHLEIFIADKSRDKSYNQTMNKLVFAKEFKETSSREILNTFYMDVPLDSGKYEAVLTVQDVNTHKQVNRKVTFHLPSFEKMPFLMSDILLFDEFERDSSGKIINIVPNLTNNFSGSTDYIFLYFNTYASGYADSLQIQYIIRDPSNYINQSNRYSIGGDSKFREHFIYLNRDQFEGSKYIIEMITSMGKYQFKFNRVFTFFWSVSPNSPKEIDKALEQLEYIANPDSVEYYLGRPFEEKKAFFKRFWASMDPNPDTPKNELMDEFYRRLNYANQAFSTLSQEGWKTDRGRIFIKFGQPEEIERHPFEIDSEPYEIWYYYSLRKEFLFIDRSGFGDYELHPSYIDQEFTP